MQIPRASGCAVLMVALFGCSAPGPDVATDVGRDAREAPETDAQGPDIELSDASSQVDNLSDLDAPEDLEDAPACGPSEGFCEGRCADTRWDPAHCGACGARCPPGVLCSLGRCQAVCDAPRSRCELGGLTRCVAALEDLANCGACGRACGEGQSCVQGRCACPVGKTQCPLRCVDVQEDPGSCGGCSVVCPAVLNARAVCRRGACGFACSEGFHPCGSACVDDRSVATCGALCTPCPAVLNGMPVCDGRACGASCVASFHVCAGVCVTNASLSTCGGGCMPCAAPANSTATCDGRACGFACAAGFHACEGACVSNLSAGTCGALCTPCPAVVGAIGTCDGRACGFSCSAALGNCDGIAGNGCETDLRVSAAHCGTCGRPCPTVAGAASTCLASACGFTCNPGFGDCDRNPANGCETDARWNVSNCGACGRACATGEVCSMAVCRVPRLAWSRSFGGAGDDGALGVAVDPAGRAVLVGRMRGPVRVNGATIAEGGSLDAFVVSLAVDTTVRWARSFGAAAADTSYSVALDAEGNSYVAGAFTGSVSFGSAPVTSAGDSDGFVVSLSPDGAVRWTRTFGGQDADDAVSVAVSAAGVYVTGTARRSVDFGAGAVAGTASPDAYALALGLDGSFRWVRRFGAVAPRVGSSGGYGIALGPDGGPVLVGFFQGAPSFGSEVLVSAGNFDIFVLSLTATGAQRWTRRMGAASVDWAQSVAVDGMNSVYVTGYYQGSVDFGGGALTAPSGTDIFLASYSVAGGHRWSRRFGGATGVYGTGTGYALAVDPAGNVFLGGNLSGAVDFGGGLRVSLGLGDAFLASFTAAGAHRFSRRFGNHGEDEIRGLATDSSGNVYSVGSFESSVDFGVGAIASAGVTDAFALQYLQ